MAGADAARTQVYLGTAHFREANEMVREALHTADVAELTEVYAQRYLGAAMPAGKRLEIHGTPGNDLACYMDGGEIEVFGNGQDQIGNTMNGGAIVIHGRCGDAAGYGMRGGSIFVRDGCGWRVGIHMKQYKDKVPLIVVGGDAGSFLGEYMAGGIIVVMGEVGEYLASGMHGGVIYLKRKPPASVLADGLLVSEADEADQAAIAQLIARYNRYFSDELPSPLYESGQGFYKVTPASSRPYAAMYVR